MRIAVCAVAIAVLGILSINASAAECTKRTKLTTGPTGIQKVVCLDGKYSTCIRDSIAVGWSADQAKSFCDGRKRLGKIS
jgi:hypothetical protein